MPPLRSSLLALAIVLAALLGTADGLRAAPDGAALGLAPSVDAIERFFDGTALLASRTSDRTSSQRPAGAPPMGVRHQAACDHGARRAARTPAPPATHGAFLVLLTHQRNDIDA